MLQWTTEEKVLLNIKKIIAVTWRMNSQQLHAYYKKLRRKCPEILPGYLGRAFLQMLDEISTLDSEERTKVWPELLRDADWLLKVIQKHQNLNEKVWKKALSRLQTQQDKTFRTELGRAFVLTLQEKLDLDISLSMQISGQSGNCAGKQTERTTQKMQDSRRTRQYEKKQANNPAWEMQLSDKRDLERVADWLMENSSKPQMAKQRKRHRYFTKFPDGTAIAISACMSLCFLSVWLYGQAERNQSFHIVQKLKAAAVSQQQAFMEKEQGTDLTTAEYAGGQTNGNETAQATSRVNLKSADTDRKKHQSTAGQSADKQKNTADRSKRPKILPQYREMAKEYPGLFGWLQIPDTQIDLPVMQPLKEKDFYLHHDFTGAASAEGALFTDPENNRWPQDGNTVIYGHNMKNGHVFGILDLYEDADYFQAHREIHFDTIYETGVYEAVAVLKTRILNENEQGFRYYQFFQYDSENEFQECLDFIKVNQLFDTGNTLEYGDHILMLSTCEYSQENGRLVIVARKI